MTTTLKAPAPTRPVKVNGPTDGDLASLWRLARLKFERHNTGQPPETKAEWAEVTAEYQALLRKQRGSLGQVITERCAEVPGGT